MSSAGFGMFGGHFKISLHKKHRVVIALGNNNDVLRNLLFSFGRNVIRHWSNRTMTERQRINECNVALLW